MSLTAALTVIAAMVVTAGAALGYLLVQIADRPIVATPPTSRCSRCDKQTPTSELRPWTELQMRCCPICDHQLTDLLFPDPTAPGYDPDMHRGYVTAYQDARQARPTA